MKRASIAALLPMWFAFASPAVAGTTGAAAAQASRVAVSLSVDEFGNHLLFKVEVSNPFRCDWSGDLYLDWQPPAGAVRSAARFPGLVVAGGSSLGLSAAIVRPFEVGDHTFWATAYRSDGEDKATFENCTTVDASCPSSGASVSVQEPGAPASLTKGLTGAELVDCASVIAPARPIRVDLTLDVQPRTVSALTAWGNMTDLDWTGDLLVEMTSPCGEVTYLHRGIGELIPAGIGFCTADTVDRPALCGTYVVRARALHRDGEARAVWHNAGSTEIVAVCNQAMCELIAPEQSRARLTLTGPSVIEVESDFFSEHTSVSLAYGGSTFDITGQCKLDQYQVGRKHHTQIAFDTMNLPIGPRTLAEYTIRIHPMPVVPPGAKLSDSLWILTNGPE